MDTVRRGYAAGWSFTPLRGKRPVLKGWQAAPRETLEQAERWAAAGNVGVRTGDASGGLLVVDLDAGKGCYDADAVKRLNLPVTVTAATGGGGYHLFYRVPVGAELGNRTGTLPAGVDIRGTGGQVVAVGSTHPDTGQPYRWMAGRGLGDVEIAPLPATILALLADPAPPAADPAADRPADPAADPAAGDRDDGDDRRRAEYAKRALADEMATVANAREGGRNSTLNDAAFRIGQLIAGGVVDAVEAKSGLLGAALACGLSKGEATATIASGLTAGGKDPRGLPPANPPRRRRRRAAHTAGDTGTGTAAAAAGQPTGGGPLRLDPERTLPTARAFLDRYAAHADGYRLACYGGQLYAWRRNCYRESEDGALRQTLFPWLHAAETLDGDPYPANPRHVENTLATVRAVVHVPATREVPFWRSGGADKPDPRELLACRSSTLHIPTGRVLDPTPDLFTWTALDFDYEPAAAEPAAWLDFLDELWPDDPAAIGMLQEWFGYLLTADTSQQKMMLLIGPRRSGKGTIGRVLTELIGRANVCGPTTGSLAEPFGLQPLLGKSLALVSDARFSGRDLQTVVERLLCISGEDALTVSRKHMDAVTVKLPVRFLFLANELPRLADAAGALAGRFLILTLSRSFYGHEHLTLTNKLIAELPGILTWALQGWLRLHKRGRFATPQSSADAETMLADLTSPVGAFVREYCTVAPGERVTVDDLYRAFVTWCEDEGRRHVPTRQGFGRELAAAVPGLRAARRNHQTGRFYEGIGLSAAADELVGARPDGGGTA